MFNVLISAHDTAWETDQLMRMPKDRFKEHSVEGGEADEVSLARPATLKLLEAVPALLLYENCIGGPAGEVVRYGYLRGIRVAGSEIVFRFAEEGRFTRALVEEFGDRLDIDQWELNRTHWAVKEGDLPRAMMKKLQPSYDVVLSFAGEDRAYVKQVAAALDAKGVRVFYDGFEEAALWGKDLAEHLDAVYRRGGTFCVVFISAAYREKMWTRHERRSALVRALADDAEYILPARFDDTEIEGIRPTLGHVTLTDKTPADLAKIILKKLGRK
ncbi:MAG TPA: TIR domain-containing protein [Opitutaceae bacterium]|nr:TIR domain-containing protein [Opitutaceae bacterium]